jgi:DNA-binding SARP family transcriptional activator
MIESHRYGAVPSPLPRGNSPLPEWISALLGVNGMIRLLTLGTLQVLDAAGQPLNAVVVQPKRVALLAYLAVASPRGFHRRDQILLVFWPDLTEDRARNALRQAVHHLRQNLGDDVILSRGADEIGIREGTVWCDVNALEAELAQGHDAAAVELYRGPLLSGFHFIAAAPEFEQWLDERRRQLVDLVTGAAYRCADSAERAGDFVGAARWAETAFQNSDGDERLLRRTLAMLHAAGDGAGALQRYTRFADQLRKQLDTVPSAETRALVASIRTGRRDDAANMAAPNMAITNSGVANVAVAHVPAAYPAPQPTTVAAPLPAGTATSGNSAWRFATVAMIAILILAGIARFTPRANTAPVSVQERAVSSAHAALSPERLVATPLYDEAVVALNERDPSAAERLFSAAVDADSTFAMAAYSAAQADRIDGHTNIPRADKFLRLAGRQSSHATDRDRLLIAEAWADFQNDPARLAIAETLAVRYPRDPEGQFSLGEARLWSGAFSAAIAPLRSAVTLDSANLTSTHSRCIACKALQLQILAFRFADSLPAAEHVARMWTVMVPSSPTAWRELALVFSSEGRTNDARSAYHASADQRHEGVGVTQDMIDLAIRSGDFSSADALARTEITSGTAPQRQQARWLSMISLRNQGRLHEALVIARTYRADAHQNSRSENLEMYEAIPEAQLLLEMGRPSQSAALFDSIARAVHPTVLARNDARNRAWIGTLSAEALYAAGDTAALARNLATVRQFGHQSAFGRDQRLSYHVDGLMNLHAGNLPAAAASFRRAIFSPTLGYTRSNYDLAVVLLPLGRAREAISIIQPALRGDLDGSNMYVTRTDLHEILAHAFDLNSQPDSAVAHYSAVAAALSRADPELAPRRLAAVRRLAQLSGFTQ